MASGWRWWGRIFVVGVLLLIAFVAVTTQVNMTHHTPNSSFQHLPSKPPLSLSLPPSQHFIFLPWLSYHPNRSLLLYLGPFNLGVASILTNYILGIFTDAGRVPAGYKPVIAKGDGGMRVKGQMKPRWCKTCKVYKPPRSHHCSVCDRCVLKMDHHCPWLNNCIGHANQGYFLRFVCSVTFSALYCLCLLALRVWDLWHYQNLLEASYSTPYDPHRPTIDFYTPPPEGPEVVFLICNLLVLFLLLLTVGILSGYQVYYTSQNITTIESFENERIETLVRQGKLAAGDVPVYPYDLGVYRNFQTVLGPHPWLWLLPLPAPGDGITHPINEATSHHLQQTGAKTVQWPPKAFFVYKRYPHGRPSRRQHEIDKQQQRYGNPRVRRGSEGFVVREWTAEEREREVQRALGRQVWSETHKPLIQLDEPRHDGRQRPGPGDGHQEEEEEEEVDSTDYSYESSSASGSEDEYEGNGSTGEEDGDTAEYDDPDPDRDLLPQQPRRRRPRPWHNNDNNNTSLSSPASSADESADDDDDDDDHELIALRHRAPLAAPDKSGSRKRGPPREYIDDGAVEAGCSGPVKKGVGI
ncbi:DHHC palmitoyltransferase-domain-containing protein [Powellomyces hirtus]|nr:DHHC palmitoyltransferase-domain-containing protein [Powellomyces hirtus]